MKILVCVDVQNDFVYGSLGSECGKKIIPYVGKKVCEYVENDEVIIFTMDVHFDDYLETPEGKNLPVKHCIANTEGCDIVKSISEKIPNEYKKLKVLAKTNFGCFKLIECIEQYDVQSILIVGLCTDICVITNALILKTAFPDIEIIVDAKGCAGVTPDTHKYALETMKMCQIKIINED